VGRACLVVQQPLPGWGRLRSAVAVPVGVGQLQECTAAVWSGLSAAAVELHPCKYAGQWLQIQCWG
jgi:hypothetical protein